MAWIYTLNKSQLGVDFLPKSLNIVGTVGTSSEIGQVKLNLIPAFVKSHGHRANERFYPCCALIVGGAESSTHILIVKDLNFESEVLLQLQVVSNQRALLTFLMIMTRNGSLMASVFLGSTGQVI